ncbi:type II toxin-antitoxin system RelE family toxin [Bacillus sp. FJAT-29937]|uniref:type II toxin-antitoxin system RelE family toxin n=1 Tax=Bacillus sp. FJAT-29937 TaxID=1720553 RepID=UPI0008308651
MYKLEFSKQSKKFIEKQDQTTKKRIRNILLSLAENPYSHSDTIKLTGYVNVYRVRIGKYRILYKIIDDRLIVYVDGIDSRGQVYKRK